MRALSVAVNKESRTNATSLSAGNNKHVDFSLPCPSFLRRSPLIAKPKLRNVASLSFDRVIPRFWVRDKDRRRRGAKGWPRRRSKSIEQKLNDWERAPRGRLIVHSNNNRNCVTGRPERGKE